jgi:hypothetical protein
VRHSLVNLFPDARGLLEQILSGSRLIAASMAGLFHTRLGAPRLLGVELLVAVRCPVSLAAAPFARHVRWDSAAVTAAHQQRSSERSPEPRCFGGLCAAMPEAADGLDFAEFLKIMHIFAQVRCCPLALPFRRLAADGCWKVMRLLCEGIAAVCLSPTLLCC